MLQLKMHVWLSMASMETDYNLKKLGQLNPLNPKIKIWILILSPYSFPREETGRSW